MDKLLDKEGISTKSSENQDDAVRTVGRNHLINRLNYLNFQDKEIISVFRHRDYDQSLQIRVKPEPCSGEDLYCSWKDAFPREYNPEDFSFDHLQLDDGMSTITFVSDTYILDNKGFHLALPETGLELTSRRIRRHQCSGIRVQMIQNGTVYKGSLKDFTPESFGVEMEVATIHSMELLNPDAPLTVTLIQSHQIVYSGECSILRQTHRRKYFTVVLKPLRDKIQKFRSQKERFDRILLVPSPNIVFKHPFTDQIVSLMISDISGSGFSVEEDLNSSILLPGMIVPSADIIFSANIKIACKVQVMYKSVVEEKKHETVIKAGFCFLDIPSTDHVQLMSILFQAQNKNLYLGREIDSDSFWQFIFESGFIYPEKYTHLYKNKNEIKKIYSKIYSHTPEVIKHITYQEKGRIHGHVAMIRVYENAWMLHHHASSLSLNRNAGVHVMGPVADYAYSAHRIPSLHLDYLMVYYRPENKFPAKVFGGFRRVLNNPKGCSEDEFAYVSVEVNTDLFFDESDGLNLNESSYEDLIDLEGFYNKVSGGLMLGAMDILPESSFNKDVKEAYEKEQLKRDFMIISLRKDENLLAVFLIDKSDIGINMSDLSNSIKAFIIKPEKLNKDLLLLVLNELAKQYYAESTHALIFPSRYSEESGMQYEKKYRLWVFGLHFSDDYYKYIRRLLRINSNK